jgi:four helix bundle protein
MRKFRDYKVWQRAMDFVESIYRVSADFPKDERYGLTNQLGRAASSVPLNIAEGAGSSTDKEFSRFLSFSLRSVYETMTALELADRLGFCSTARAKELLGEADQIAAMLYSLRKKLAAGTRQIAEETAGYEVDALESLLASNNSFDTESLAERAKS